jgi:hypothetical protein
MPWKTILAAVTAVAVALNGVFAIMPPDQLNSLLMAVMTAIGLLLHHKFDTSE